MRRAYTDSRHSGFSILFPAGEAFPKLERLRVSRITLEASLFIASSLIFRMYIIVECVSVCPMFVE